MIRAAAILLLATLSACSTYDPEKDIPIDPVCGKPVDRATGIFFRYDRWSYWVDSEACKSKFLAHPATYVDMTRYTFSHYD